MKRFYEGLKGFHKTFRGTTKKCENKNLNKFFILRSGLGREGLRSTLLNVDLKFENSFKHKRFSSPHYRVF